MKQGECLDAKRIGELSRLTVDRLHPLAAGRRAQSLESGASGACGLHPPHRRPTSRLVVEHEVFDHWGRFVARGDVWIVGTNRLHEFDGGGHRKPDIQRAGMPSGSVDGMH
jgi:hypothetical protein